MSFEGIMPGTVIDDGVVLHTRYRNVVPVRWIDKVILFVMS